MPDETLDAQVEQEQEEQVLRREGLEEELMQEDRSEDGTTIADAETGEEHR